MIIDFTKKTAIGSLSNYISTFNTDFQPMNVNFGIFEELNVRCKKIDRKEMYAKRALETLDGLLGAVNERK